MQELETKAIDFFRKVSVPLARFAIFLVYFWFGILKVLGLSPASGLVHTLFDKTLAFLMSFGTFFILFGLLECLIGIMFLIPKLDRLAIVILFLHIFTTVLPLVLLPSMVWNGFLVPTIEGQYIIKNILIISAAICIGASLRPRSVL